MKLSKKLLESAYNSKLINFDSNDENNIFKKSKIEDKKITDRCFYDFYNCMPGDKIYYDPTWSYNLITGELIGYCVIPVNADYADPIFLYKDIILSAANWDHAIGDVPESHKDENNREINYYLPSLQEFLDADEYAHDLIFDDYMVLWTSTEAEKNYVVNAYAINDNRKYQLVSKQSMFSVKIFFTIK